MKKLSSLALLLFICLAAKSQTKIDIKDVAKHIGDSVTICDSVYTTRALNGLTLINLGAAFPKQLLTVVIYKADLGKFTEPEKTYLYKRVCVTGKLVLYNDRPQIVVNEVKQIK
ncbi:hypothetical protein EZ428_18695 [Pedobacter frigiditerrae]|uniref:DNA-binding protein n=1 Tax=Pedobacter frigiditerrae TaxID=2530452 RepID=A0A4R0MQ34_9SPHI|nr:hypothetical protein [Pedobacter frigiditerrae]TCC88667.1 hypothetical protein EZ428_18695 [Pedobacter frigiditerrae]